MTRVYGGTRRSREAAPRARLSALAGAIALIVVLARAVPAADVLRVPRDFPTIQQALDHAVNGDEVHVAARDEAYAGPGNRPLDFHGKAIALIGTGGPERTRIDATGHFESVFVIAGGETRETVVDGFTIVNAVALRGGAIRITGGSSPTIRNCHFLRNTAQIGGAIASRDAAQPVIENCVFRENNASAIGGAVDFETTGRVDIVGCEFYENLCHLTGGALSARLSAVVVDGCKFIGNYARNKGGAVYYAGNSDGAGTFVNSVFAGNRSPLHGAGIVCQGTSPWILHCTFFGNLGGAIRWSPGTTHRAANCILWKNRPPQIDASDLPGSPPFNLVEVDPGFVEDGQFTVVFEEVRGGEDLRVPRFIVTEGDYALTSVSTAAINAAVLKHSPLTDLAGKDRGCGGDGLPDLGAFEYCPDPFRRGDATADGAIVLGDAIVVLEALLRGGPWLPCEDASDVNDDGRVTVGDPVLLLSWLFLGGGAPAAPFPACGPDPTRDTLECDRAPPCQ